MFKRLVISLFAAALLAPHAGLAQETSMSALETTFADVNGVRLATHTLGEGKPLIVLHGGLGSTAMFGPNLPALAEGHRVIGVDLQGHGATGPLGRPMTFETLASDIAELIGALGYEKADVMGYSLGGATALRLALDHPELIDHLVLASTAFAFDNWHAYNAEGMKATGADPAGTAAMMQGTPLYGAFVSQAPRGADDWLPAITEVAGLVGADYDWSSEIGQLQPPTLLVYGDWDAVRINKAISFFEALGGGRQDAGWDRSGMNRNRLAVLPNTTHYDIFMSPALAETVLPFLADYEQ